MGKTTQRTSTRIAFLASAIALGLGCATAGPLESPGYAYFERPDPGDAWSRKIELWQARERIDHAPVPAALPPMAELPADQAASTPVDEGPDRPPREVPAADLRAKYSAFRSEQKRTAARGLAEWIQGQAQEHYIADGPIDHWATLGETFRSNGDDCDGLELLVYHMLLDLGFESNEVYRAVVFRRSDGQHHMVTLWFEERDDPWVIDPTGAMTSGMPRMSSLPEWVPLKVFTEDEDFTVARRNAFP